MKKKSLLFTAVSILFLTGLAQAQTNKKAASPVRGSFGYDLEFLKKHQSDLVLLQTDEGKAQVAVSTAYQGRVMTSTASGLQGPSFGWINYAQIESETPAKHINAYGGEERFWLGPEGGQYSLFFKPGVPFTFDNWFVPKELDTEPFNLREAGETEARFERTMLLTNYAGTQFNLNVERNIRILNKKLICNLLEYNIPDAVETVGFESENILKNTGLNAWDKTTGMPSIWILSMLNASPGAVVAVAYDQGDEEQLGPVVTDNYFGKVPKERLRVENGLIFFKADGQKRSKIGVSAKRAFPVAVSWNPEAGVLTVMQFSMDNMAKDYVNSLWEQQKEPFKGDVINAYNDGPNDSGKQLGNFYELESSSPAAALKPGQSLTHVHRTIHLKGSEADLDPIARQLLGVGIREIKL